LFSVALKIRHHSRHYKLVRTMDD